MAIQHARLFPRAFGIAVGLSALAQAFVIGQEPALPPARDVVARHLAAIGGESAHKALSSIHATGTVELIGSGLSGTVEIFSARPAKMIVRLEVAPVGRVETGFDGKVGWEIDPARGPALLAGRRLSELSDEAWFDATLHGSDRVRSMTTVAKTEFDKRPVYQVKIVYTSGNELVEYYDVETSLLIGSEGARETAMGVLPMTTTLRDYRKFGPLLEATTLSQRVMGIEQVVRLSSFEYDKVPANTFDLPPQIRALVR